MTPGESLTPPVSGVPSPGWPATASRGDGEPSSKREAGRVLPPVGVCPHCSPPALRSASDLHEALASRRDGDASPYGVCADWLTRRRTRRRAGRVPRRPGAGVTKPRLDTAPPRPGATRCRRLPGRRSRLSNCRPNVRQGEDPLEWLMKSDTLPPPIRRPPIAGLSGWGRKRPRFHH